MNDSHPVTWLDGRQSTGQAVIRLSDNDNVAVALRTLKAGETVVTSDSPPDDSSSSSSSSSSAVDVIERVIEKGIKLAIRPIVRGDRIVKYDQLIGVASCDIGPGEHVHTHNVAFTLNDASYHRDAPMQVEAPESLDSFLGYRRADGRVGTRNYIAVISSVNCSATVAHHICAAFDQTRLAAFAHVDGVAAFTHGTGCGMDHNSEGFANLQRVLAGYANHPNVGGVLFVGLGCETSQIAETLNAFNLSDGPLLRTMNIQTTGGHVRTVARGVELINDMLGDVNTVARTECSVADLTLALQCGGSDAWSGITANPALGYAADLLVKQGGTAVLAETPEIYGAEHLLIRRAVTQHVADHLIERIHWWQAYVDKHQGSLDNNPSPGNKLGGLTTILEKSLGAVAKGGTSPLNGVFHYAEKINKKGFVFMDSPGYDPASVTGQIAAGCNLVAFTTGRGSTFGSKPSPCIKIATNTDMFKNLSDDMDVNAGTIVSEGDSVAAVGQRIYQRLLAVASGEPSCSERHGLGDNEFVPWQIGATM